MSPASPPSSPGSSRGLPLVAISCCVKEMGLHAFHVAGDKYVRAVAEGAQAMPALLPALGDWYDLDDVVDRFDGVLLTGSISNVAPALYGGPAMNPQAPVDHERDATTLPLIRRAIQAGVPLLAICRGIQELNVALGGTLHQKIHEVPGRLDHRSDKSLPVEGQYALAHSVSLEPGGILARLTGRAEIRVNSIHWQGIDVLAPGLAIEARAPDGQIEAVRVTDAPGFALGVQWHPEWRFWEDPPSAALFAAFGEAVRARAGQRQTARAAE